MQLTHLTPLLYALPKIVKQFLHVLADGIVYRALKVEEVYYFCLASYSKNFSLFVAVERVENETEWM